MAGAYVCANCRIQLLRRAGRLRNPQWHSKATFLSFTSSKPPSDGSQASKDQAAAAEDIQRPPDSQIEHRHGGNADNGQYEELLSMLPSRKAPLTGRYSRYVRKDVPRDGQDKTEDAASRELLQGQHAHRGPKIPKVEIATPHASRIVRNLDSGNTTAAWEQFLDSFGQSDSPALVQPALQDLPFLNRGGVFHRLLRDCTKEWLNGPAPKGPSPAEVVLKLEQIRVMRPEFWHEILWLLTYQTLGRSAAVDAQVEQQERLMHELMALWRLFFRCNGIHAAVPDKLSDDWPYLPFRTDPNQGPIHSTRDFQQRLQKFHPKLPGQTTLSLSALITFDLLTHGNAFALLRSSNANFVKGIAHILPNSNLDPLLDEARLSLELNSLPHDYRDELLERLQSSPAQAMLIVGSRNSMNMDPAAQQDPADAKEIEELFLKRIARAFDKQNEKIAETLWREAQSVYKQGTNESVNIPSRIYDAFLTGFMASRRSNRAVDIWNFMVANGTQPTVVTWTAMLSGCEKSRDLEGLKEMWERMLRAGVQPDEHAWTTRIHGLLSLRQVGAGLSALDEMGRTWKAAQAMAEAPGQPTKGKTPAPAPHTSKAVINAPKPTVQTINGALTAISRLPNTNWNKKRELMDRVLKWAGSYLIGPNVITYNILIKIAFRENNTAEVFKLLKTMKAENIEPDIATFTMILSASFQNPKYAEMDEEKQSQVAITLLRDLESRGMDLNEVTYGVAINSLLKDHNNFAATRAVLNHMAERSLRAGPHIYTSLITHYLSRDPPAIAAVDSLWSQITSTSGNTIDSVLFDRVIEGYARYGEVGKMMAVLARMSQQGKTPGWRALRLTIKALVESGDAERARGIVRDVLLGQGYARNGVSNRAQGAYGMSDFWATVEECGFGDMLREAGVQSAGSGQLQEQGEVAA